jgi:hypothetical protein
VSTQDNVTITDYVETMARTENGFLFVDADGILTFKNRHFTGMGTVKAAFSDVPADWPASIDYLDIAERAATMLLYNEVSATRDNGVTQIAQDTTPTSQFMVRSLDLSGLQNQTNEDVRNLAAYMVGDTPSRTCASTTSPSSSQASLTIRQRPCSALRSPTP